MKQILFLACGLLAFEAQSQLVVQNGATLFVDAGATITVQGDLTSNANIGGTGKIVMKGSSLQTLNMNGFTIPNLDIDNAAHVTLGSAATVTGTLNFVTGKLQLGSNNFILGPSATIAGTPGTNKFAETNGTGEFRKEVTAAGTYVLPVGVGSEYNPVSYTLAGNTFSSAYVGARAVNAGHPNKHPRSSDFLNHYWSLSRSGITGGTVSAVGTYVDGTDVTGIEADMRSMTFSGGNWALGTGQDNTANTVSANMTGNSTDLYAMNRFVLVTPTVFFQGPFNSGTGLMNDRLRNQSGTYNPGNASGTNIIPSSDPYRQAPYSSFFTHVNNTVAESVVSAAVFNDLANPSENIVDWVFVELRTSTNATTAPVLQTRSALVRRDGRLVDIDGVSPVYFKNVDPASNYVVAIRHRNHLGISSNPSSGLSLSLSNTNFDFTNTSNTSNIFGTANTNYTQIASKNVLWAGNARNNSASNWSGLNNDKDYLYITILGSNSGASVGGYSAGDLNLNRTASWSGLGNDKDFLYITVLGSNSGGTKSQALPAN
jgi:hypothetical protein